MNLAETVTFGGAGRDRAAHLRKGGAEFEALRQASDARAILCWRGKPLLDESGVVRIPLDHPVLAEIEEPPYLLGLEEGALRLSYDLGDWMPPDMDPEKERALFSPAIVSYPGLPGGFQDLRVVMSRLPAIDAEMAVTARALDAWHGSHRFCARCGAESVPAQMGWQRDCPSCGSHHFPRTDPVVIMLVTHGNKVLLGRSPGWPDGMYSLLAGFVEPGETLEAAVRREVAEEAGVRIGAVRYLTSQPWPFPASLMMGCHAEAETTEITIDPVEIEEALWLTREEMAAVMRGENPAIRRPRRGPIAGFLLEHWLADSSL